MTSTATIYVLAGVNGSGKSSLAGAAIRSRGIDYYNPDEAAHRIRSTHPNLSQETANGHAWTLGKDLLANAIARRSSFAFETTLGGQTIAKLLAEAAANGLHVSVWYVGLASVELNIARVRKRVSQGGHDIPEAKIRERWDASRRNLIRLLPSLHNLRVFDNSHEADPTAAQSPKPLLLLDVADRKIVGPKDLSKTPEWAKPIVAAALNAFPRDP